MSTPKNSQDPLVKALSESITKLAKTNNWKSPTKSPEEQLKEQQLQQKQNSPLNYYWGEQKSKSNSLYEDSNSSVDNANQMSSNKQSEARRNMAPYIKTGLARDPEQVKSIAKTAAQTPASTTSVIRPTTQQILDKTSPLNTPKAIVRGLGNAVKTITSSLYENSNSSVASYMFKQLNERNYQTAIGRNIESQTVSLTPSRRVPSGSGGDIDETQVTGSIPKYDTRPASSTPVAKKTDETPASATSTAPKTSSTWADTGEAIGSAFGSGVVPMFPGVGKAIGGAWGRGLGTNVDTGIAAATAVGNFVIDTDKAVRDAIVNTDKAVRDAIDDVTLSPSQLADKVTTENEAAKAKVRQERPDLDQLWAQDRQIRNMANELEAEKAKSAASSTATSQTGSVTSSTPVTSSSSANNAKSVPPSSYGTGEFLMKRPGEPGYEAPSSSASGSAPTFTPVTSSNSTPNSATSASGVKRQRGGSSNINITFSPSVLSGNTTTGNNTTTVVGNQNTGSGNQNTGIGQIPATDTFEMSLRKKAEEIRNKDEAVIASLPEAMRQNKSPAATPTVTPPPAPESAPTPTQSSSPDWITSGSNTPSRVSGSATPAATPQTPEEKYDSENPVNQPLPDAQSTQRRQAQDAANWQEGRRKRHNQERKPRL